MKGAVVLGMTSLVIIFAVFLRSKRSFTWSMRLMSLQIRKMRPNILSIVLSIQQLNNIQHYERKTTYMSYPRPQFWFKDLAEEMENPVGSVGL